MKDFASNADRDHLAEYTTTVHGLHAKIALVVERQKDLAESLGRAGAALRSIGALNHRKTNPAFGKPDYFSQEKSLAIIPINIGYIY